MLSEPCGQPRQALPEADSHATRVLDVQVVALHNTSNHAVVLQGPGDEPRSAHLRCIHDRAGTLWGVVYGLQRCRDTAWNLM